MGCYINPKNEPKEEWVERHGQQISEEDVRAWKYVDPGGLVPVALIDNHGAFYAAGVLYDDAERQRFFRSLDYERKACESQRPMSYWLIEINAVRTVSDYDDYARAS